MAAQTALDLASPTSLSKSVRSATGNEYLLVVALIGADAFALFGAFALAYIIRFKLGIPFLETPPHRVAFYSSVAFWAVPVWLLIFFLSRLYDRRNLFVGFEEYTRVFNACTGGLVATIVVSFLDRTLIISRGWLLLVWMLAIVLVGSTRFVGRRVLRRLRARGHLIRRTLIVGANAEGQAIAEQFLSDPGSGTRVVGFVDGPQVTVDRELDGVSVLGSLGDLEKIVNERGVNEIVVAMTSVSREDLLDIFKRFGHAEGIEVRLSSGLFEILTTGVRVQEVSQVPLMTPQRVRITGVDAAMKFVLDYVGAALGLVLLSPIFLVIAVLIKLDSPGPVLHRRRVLGRSGVRFDAYKFRTMVVDADAVLAANLELRAAFEKGYKLAEDPRVTRVGRFLRRTSLDELPQLINVLRGEMSLVGPRMIAPDEASRYGKWQLNLLTVKPGITGPWQVRGRSDIPYEERVRLSTQYIRNYSIWLDLEILLQTFPAVLLGKGAY